MTNAVVDDTIFINNGWFEVQASDLFQFRTGPQRLGLPPNSILGYSDVPWDGSRVVTWVNNGSMIGLSMRFDTVDPSTGNRTPAQSFENTVSGVIDAANPFGLTSTTGIEDLIGGLGVSSLVRVQANSIVNEGFIRAGTTGLIHLRGDSVDLSFGALAIDPLGFFRGVGGYCGAGITIDAGNNWVSYFNDAGIYDQYWGIGQQTNLNVNPFMSTNPIQVIAPTHNVSTGGPQFGTSIFLNDAQSFAYAYQLDATNVVVQAAFVQKTDPNLQVSVQWVPIGLPNGIQIDKFLTTEVKLQAGLFDPLTLTVMTNLVVIWDMLGSTTNANLIPEAAIASSVGGTGFRPGAYFVSRCDFGFGPLVQQTNIIIGPEYFFGPNFATANPTNFYAGAGFLIDSLPSRPQLLPGVSTMDFPGRIEIESPSVNLLRTGLRGEGMVSIVTDDLISSDGTVVDSQNLNFNLARQNGPLRIQNLSKDVVERLSGNVEMWSGVWTNLFTNIITGEVETWAYHVTIVDATSVTSKQEVTVADFVVRAPTADLIISDNMIVSNRFEFAGQNLTISGTNELRSSAWASTNLPNLVNFTNTSTGVLRLNGLAMFGSDSRPLNNFNNAGTIGSFAVAIDAANVEHSGLIFSGQREFFFTNLFDPAFAFIFTNSGPITINARESALLDGGQLVTYGDITLAGRVYKLNNTTLTSGSAIHLNVTGPQSAIQDSGVGSGNIFVVSNAFNMLAAPSYGNLLGSAVVAQPARARAFRSRWAVPDSGSSDAAFQSSSAIGRYVLNTDTNSLFEFRGTTAGRALYVDVLEIRGPGITNLATLNFNLYLQNGIKIYYGSVEAPELEDDAAAQSMTVSEWLNGRVMTGGGTLVWAPNFIGEESAVDVARLNGTTTRMNRSLRESLIIDTDGDGIPNGLDAFPLDNQLPPIIVAAPSGIPRASISFQAAANKTYVVESSPAVAGGAWRLVETYRNNQPTQIQVTITDSVAATDAARFYRVREQ